MQLQALIQNPAYKKKFVLEKLLCHYLDKTRTELWTDAEQELSEELVKKIQEDYRAYEEDEKPLEYILGFVEFFGVRFWVNEHTLIPRPETEYMITAITEELQSREDSDHILLDIGTGSGVLGCSVLLQNGGKIKEVFLADISADALYVANRNYNDLIDGSLYDTRIVQSDLCAFLESYSGIIEGRKLIMTANLPYIPDQTFDENSPANVQKWEPRFAFVGGDDGLDLYRKMFAQLLELKDQVSDLVMFLEMMTWQVDILRKEYEGVIEFEEVKTFHFNIRIVKARFI
ncbi:peptide chain release factor N(5)-glutamine methyltransferase [Candidatus Gracilibacteria bacterium]|nr:MAG: peptide chain release factor N(5)-glutamine methyltransferase [Candidatus Gracilibacteria bacterium]